MKNKFLFALLLLNTTLAFGQTPNPHIPNQVIIGFADDADQADRQLLIDELGSLLGGIITTPSGAVIAQEVLILVDSYPVQVGNDIYNSELDLISNIQGQHAKVDHADFNYTMTTEQYSFSTFLGSNNLDQYSPISPGCEANYPGGPLEGGEAEPSTALVKVGILDTGLDPYYPTINQYVAAEVNVLTDDQDPEAGITISYGYNTANPVALDDNGHGTAVAGIIAGLADRANVAPANLELYIIKCFDSEGNGAMFNMLQAVRMAQMLDLDVINLSWGYLPVPEDAYATALESAIQSLGNEENMIIVSGAGNEAKDLTTYPYAPAAIQGVANLITVAGTVGEERSCNGGLATFSNYGDAAEIAAPSASISAPGLDGFWTLNTSGTSFAAPIVAAAVIQSWIAHDDNFEEPYLYGEIHPICEIVLNTAKEVPMLTTMGIEGVVNFGAACNTSGVVYLQEDDQQSTITTSSKSDEQENKAVMENLHISPNPFTDQLMVRFDGDQSKAGRLRVSTLQGAAVLEQEMESFGEGTTIVQLPAHLPSGPYLLQMNRNGQIHTKMIVKN